MSANAQQAKKQHNQTRQKQNDTPQSDFEAIFNWSSTWWTTQICSLLNKPLKNNKKSPARYNYKVFFCPFFHSWPALGVDSESPMITRGAVLGKFYVKHFFMNAWSIAYGLYRLGDNSNKLLNIFNKYLQSSFMGSTGVIVKILATLSCITLIENLRALHVSFYLHVWAA